MWGHFPLCLPVAPTAVTCVVSLDHSSQPRRATKMLMGEREVHCRHQMGQGGSPVLKRRLPLGHLGVQSLGIRLLLRL